MRTLQDAADLVPSPEPSPRRALPNEDAYSRTAFSDEQQNYPTFCGSATMSVYCDALHLLKGNKEDKLRFFPRRNPIPVARAQFFRQRIRAPMSSPLALPLCCRSKRHLI